MKKIIYLYTNKLNNKQYVGQTQRDAKERYMEHARKHGTAFDMALDKYGADNFKFEIIDEAKDNVELNEKETYWIKKLNTIAPNGYNLCFGGNATSGYHHSKESKMKISMTKKEKCSMVGIKNHFYGKHHSPEEIKKMKAAWTAERKRINTLRLAKFHSTKAVKNVTTGKTFKSIKEAAEFYKLKATHITRVLKGKRKTTGGFKWEYLNK